MFIFIPIIIFSAYSYLFLHDTVGIAYFSYFYPLFDIIAALGLTILVTFIISINYYIINSNKNANRKNTTLAIIFSLLSTPFCCNVLIPLLIAYFVGSVALSPVYLSTQNILIESDPVIIIVSIAIIYFLYKRSIKALLKCKINFRKNFGVARI